MTHPRMLGKARNFMSVSGIQGVPPDPKLGSNICKHLDPTSLSDRISTEHTLPRGAGQTPVERRPGWNMGCVAGLGIDLWSSWGRRGVDLRAAFGARPGVHPCLGGCAADVQTESGPCGPGSTCGGAVPRRPLATPRGTIHLGAAMPRLALLALCAALPTAALRATPSASAPAEAPRPPASGRPHGGRGALELHLGRDFGRGLEEARAPRPPERRRAPRRTGPPGIGGATPGLRDPGLPVSPAEIDLARISSPADVARGPQIGPPLRPQIGIRPTPDRPRLDPRWAPRRA